MANDLILTTASAVQIDFLPDGKTPTISSPQLAEHFGIKHQHILRDIRAILNKIPVEWGQSSFGQSDYLNNQNKIQPCYLLTRDGFTLLAMGYNSARAIQWKIRYIEAFNALERAVLDQAQEAARMEGSRAAIETMAKLHARITPERLARVRKAARYKKKELTIREIAKLMDCDRSTVGAYLRTARTFGLEV